ARTEIGFNEQWQRTLDYSLYAALPASSGDVLAVSFTADEEQLLFDFYKLDHRNGKIIKKIPLKSGDLFPFKSEDGQAYLMLYDTTAKALILYDENLNILWSLENTSYPSYFEDIVYWEIVDGQFRFYDNRQLVPVAGFTKAGVELSFPKGDYERPVLTPCNGEAFCPELASVDVQIRDAGRNIDRTVTLKPDFPDNHIVNFVSVFVYDWERYLDMEAYREIDFTQPDRYMMYINSVHIEDESHMTHRFIEFNVKGEIVKEIEFARDELDYDFFSTGDRFAFAHGREYMLLNLETMEMDTDSLDSTVAYSSSYEYPSYLMTDESFYLFKEGYALGQKFARLQPERDLLTILNNYVLVHSLNKQVPTLVYDRKTGRAAGEMKQALDFMDMGKTGNMLVHSPSIGEYSYTLTMVQPAPVKSYAQHKTWTVTFNRSLDARSVNDQTVYVLDSAGEHVKDVTLSIDKKTLSIHAPAAGYAPGASYTLVITGGIKAANGKAMTSGQTKKFKIK
ncbi:MAG: Ig-like domain-containing protein, partial [Lysinibacillus sp.]